MKTAGDKWYPGETISVAIGQGPVLVTALQMASLYSVIATDGLQLQPHLLTNVLDAGGKVIKTLKYEKETIRGIDRQNFEIVKKALWGVVNETGTGTKAKITGFDVCGKTGTVQVIGYERGGNLWKEQKERFGDHAWFIAFAPYQDPEIAISIFVQHGGHGSEAAAPLAKAIFEAHLVQHAIQGPPAEDEIQQVQTILLQKKSPQNMVMSTRSRPAENTE